MSIRRFVGYAIGGAVLIGITPAFAEEHEPLYLDAPGIGVVADVGNDRAEGIKMFPEDQIIAQDMKAMVPPEVAATPFFGNADGGGDN